jgi:hypothetical protein
MIVFLVVIENNSNKGLREASVYDDSDESIIYYKHTDTICENHLVEIFGVPLHDSTPTLFRASAIKALQENRVHSLVILYSSVPRNITELYSSVPKLRNIRGTDEYRARIFIG